MTIDEIMEHVTGNHAARIWKCYSTSVGGPEKVIVILDAGLRVENSDSHRIDLTTSMTEKDIDRLMCQVEACRCFECQRSSW